MSKLKFMCWLLVLVFLASVAVAVAWRVLVGPKYTAKAFLELKRCNPHILPNAAEKYDPDEFEIFRENQQGLIKSHWVINAALRDPRLKNRACISREDTRHNAINWLTKEIRVDFSSKNAGIMVVSATEPDPEDAQAMVNAVVDAYMNEVVDNDKQRRRTRLSQLTQISVEKETEVRQKRELLKRELENLGASDDETMKAKAQLAMQIYAEFQREFQRMQSERRILLGKIRELTKALAELPKAEVPEIEVTAHLNNNPVYRDLCSRLMLLELNKLKAGAAAPAAKRPSEPEKTSGPDKTPEPDQTQAEYDAMKKLLDRLEQQCRDQVRNAKRIALEQEKSRLECQLEVSTDHLKSFEKEVENRQKEAENMGKTSIAALMAKADVANIERILRAVSEERERLRVELASEDRVAVIGDRNAPAAVPENLD